MWAVLWMSVMVRKALSVQGEGLLTSEGRAQFTEKAAICQLDVQFLASVCRLRVEECTRTATHLLERTRSAHLVMSLHVFHGSLLGVKDFVAVAVITHGAMESTVGSLEQMLICCVLAGKDHVGKPPRTA